MSTHSGCKPLQSLCVTAGQPLDVWEGCSRAPERCHPSAAPALALGHRHELQPHCLMCDQLLARLWAAKARMVRVTGPKRVWFGASGRAGTACIVMVILCHHIRLVSAPCCGLIHPALISTA